jgi:hypothetical protein
MRRGWTALSLLLLAGCGGAPAAGGAKTPPSHEAPTMVPGSETKEEPALDYGSAQAKFNEAESAFAAAGNDCAQLCKALSSMTRATERLCELAKDNGDDKRCTDATSRLESARAKVKSSCGGCE